jgi:type II secretory pathway pseudopilin PulG
MSRNPKRLVGAFTIAEVLVAVAIVSILLAAVAVAFNASIINYRENNDIFQAMNRARQALFRMTTQLRTADAVNPDSLTDECSLITTGGEDITYRYNAAQRKLYLVTNDNLSDGDYMLCNNVTGLTFTKQIVTEGSETKVKSVQISITVAAGDIQKTVAAAAVVRRNLN